MKQSLWLNPRKVTVKVRLERFRWYPYFLAALDQYEKLTVPKVVPVRWEPTKGFLEALEADPEEESRFIEHLSFLIAEGQDVPPIVRDGQELFDGRHRAWAAHDLGIKLAPVMDVSPYWKRD